MGLVSMATTRPQAGHLKAAASVPSPGSWRSSNTIWASQSTQRNFIRLRIADCGLRNDSSRAPDASGKVVPHHGAGMERHACEHCDAEFGREVGTGGAGETPPHHVLDDAQQPC